MRVFWFFLILFFGANLQGEGLYQFMSQKAYEKWLGKDCHAPTKEEITKLEALCTTNCINPGVAPNEPIKNQDLDKLSERIFFNYAASKQLEGFDCLQQKIGAFKKNSPGGAELQKKVIEDIAHKLPTLNAQYLRLTELKRQLRDNQMLGPHSLPEQIAAVAKQTAGLRNEFDMISQRYGAMYASIWGNQLPEMQDYLTSVIKKNEDPEKFFKEAFDDGGFDKNILGKIQENITEGRSSLLSQSHLDPKDGRTFDLDAESKELIIKRGDVFENVLKDPESSQYFSNLSCRLEGRYGKGTTYLNNTILATSYLLAGTEVAVAKISSVGEIAATVTSWRTGISLNAARGLFYGSALLSTERSLKKVDQMCFANHPVSTVSTDACDARDPNLTKKEIENLQQGNCALALLSPVISTAGNYAANFALKAFRGQTLSQYLGAEEEAAERAGAAKVAAAEEREGAGASADVTTTTATGSASGVTATTQGAAVPRPAANRPKLKETAGLLQKDIDELNNEIKGSLLKVKRLNSTRTNAANEKVLQQLKTFPQEIRNPNRQVGVTEAGVWTIYNRVASNPVASLCKLGKYDILGDMGFCFGRAVAAHLEALRFGLQKDQIRKIWAVGTINVPGTLKQHRYEVATLVRSQGGGWWAIDPRMGRPLKVDQWYEKMKLRDDDYTMRIFTTEAKRFGPTSPQKYNKLALHNDEMNGFFKDLFDSFRENIKTITDEDGPLPTE